MGKEMGIRSDVIPKAGMWTQSHLLNKMGEIQKYFHNLWPDGKPLFKLFRTEQTGYLYDTGTNKIFGCRNLELNLF
jgi:hypothetical protein